MLSGFQRQNKRMGAAAGTTTPGGYTEEQLGMIRMMMLSQSMGGMSIAILLLYISKYFWLSIRFEFIFYLIVHVYYIKKFKVVL